jgi:hypothetical protein
MKQGLFYRSIETKVIDLGSTFSSLQRGDDIVTDPAGAELRAVNAQMNVPQELAEKEWPRGREQRLYDAPNYLLITSSRRASSALVLGRFRSIYFDAPFSGRRSRRTAGILMVFGWQEQYGNNLGRKPSQMIPNNPKWVLL